MGGSQPQTPAPPPQPPSTTETSAQAIQAQIDALPKILEAQQKYGDQFSQEQLDALNQFGPQFAESALNLQQKYAPQYKAISDILNPEIGVAQKTLADFLSQTDDAEYNALVPGAVADFRAAQSQRGIGAISPLGSIDESVQLVRLKQSLKDRRLNVAMSTAGRVPISGMAQVNGTSGTGQLVQNVNPDSVFNYQNGLNNFSAQLYDSQAGIFNSQSVAATARRESNSRGVLKWII
jgi:hypothetical protein